ncbi:MAG: 2,3-cyclic 3-phosphodiesterase [Bacillota bacterium]|nr:2,3-cyclic 3-phosphodiesterase [Bacillota bacterium]MDK2855562.1 2,3-cyclic 3-phosphodiesterase [Bacillota bacterium]MDK2925811.1 2,3-cyclic 3-phosphodiesterase [Bacillota bacterium]
MRTFLALPLEPAVRQELVRYQQACARMIANVKWVEEENLHLTLKFLGEVPEEKLAEVISVAGKVAARFPALTLPLGRPGAFPNLGRARVLWVGLADDGDKLRLLARQLEQELALLGFPQEERAFVAHLTLGRLRKPARVVLPPFSGEGMPVRLLKVVFYRSVLTPRGPLYQTLSEFELSRLNKGARNYGKAEGFRNGAPSD